MTKCDHERFTENISLAIKNSIKILNTVKKYVPEIKFKICYRCTGNISSSSFLKAKCPFCNKDEFTLSPENIFYCFGCHEGGDNISFVATFRKVKQTEAMRFLINDMFDELETMHPEVHDREEDEQTK